MATDTKVKQHYYKPLGACADLFDVRDAEVLISGPAGTGKSRACLEKVHLLALVNPGMRGLIVRKTLTSLGSTALVTFRNYVIKEALENIIVSYYGGSAQDPPQYRYKNGSVIVLGGMDKASRIMSSEYDVIYVQEATELTEDDWEALTTRLRNWKVSFQQIIGDCNPDRPTHWLKVRCDKGVTKALYSKHEDNPLIYQGGLLTKLGKIYMSKLARLTGVRYLRLCKGVWAAAEGLIYEEWDPSIHLVDSFDIPYDWPRWWAVDFGFTNPFVCQMWAEDPDGRLYMYRELYHTKRTVDVHAKHLLQSVATLGRWEDPKPRGIICDHDAEGRTVLERELGLSTIPAFKKITEGIQAVQKRLRVAGDGKPRLALFRRAIIEKDLDLIEEKKPTCTEEEVVGYVWETTKGLIREVPHKQDDHGMDAMRYLVAYRDLAARPRIRVLA